jgi:hypothetical protein
MATSTFFNNFSQSSEQTLLEDLVIESIKIYGQDMYYLPRTRGSFDKVYYEDTVSSFNDAYMIEVYVRSYNGFEGAGSMMNKLGMLEIRDQVILSVARRRFGDEITEAQSEILRPREGDLLYFPLNRKCFEIQYTDNKPFFYQLGDLQMFDMTCELFEYSSEIFNTGIAEIDSLQQNHSINVQDYGVLTENDQVINTDEDQTVVNELFDSIKEVSDPGEDTEFTRQENTDHDVINYSENNPLFGPDTRR